MITARRQSPGHRPAWSLPAQALDAYLAARKKAAPRLKVVENMARVCTHDQIARVIGISDETLRKYYRQELDTAKEIGLSDGLARTGRARRFGFILRFPHGPEPVFVLFLGVSGHFTPAQLGAKGAVTIDYPDKAFGQIALLKAVGTSDDDFLAGLLKQLINAGSQGPNADESGTNFMLAVVKGVEPRDQVEAMLAAQMAAS